MITDENANIVGISEEKREVVIPNSINGIEVKEIKALKAQCIEKLVLSRNIVKVGNLDIKEGATVKLPSASVKFSDDQDLSKYLIEIQGGKISEDFFSDNKTLKRIKLTDKTIGLKTALERAGISELILGGAIYLNEDVSAFIEKMTLDSVNSLENTVITPQQSLKTLEIRSDYFIEYEEEDFVCFQNVDTIVLGENVTICEKYISECLRGKTLTFTNEVTSLENADFRKVEFSKIIIPDSVTDISGAQFGNNEYLKDVVLGKGITVLPDNIFEYCTLLSNINLKNVTKIGDYAFRNAVALSEAEFSNKLQNIGEFAFSGSALTSVMLSDCENIIEIPQGAFSSCINLIEVVLGDNIKSIGDFAFSNTAIEIFQLPQNTDYLGKHVFSGSKLKVFNSNSLLKEIPDACFNNCVDLAEVNLCEGLERILSCSFTLCHSLKSLEIPSTVTQIVNAQIDNNTKLILKGDNFIEVGNYTLTADGERVVHYYGNENEYVLPETVKYVNDYVPFNLSYGKITFSSGLLDLGNTACTRINHIVIPEGMQTLPDMNPKNCEILQFLGETPPVCDNEILINAEKILIPSQSENIYKEYFAQFLTNKQMAKIELC